MVDRKVRILILYYSSYGHIYRMSKAVGNGVKEARGDGIIMQVPELVPETYWNDNIRKTKEMMKHVPIADPRHVFQGIDGLIVGTPTRYGNMCAQMRNFWDQTGSEWVKGTLVGKPAAVFTSSNTQHGGQETTIISTMLTLFHHGCIIVGLPYTVEEQSIMTEITGGSPYGASTIAGSGGQRVPSENELKMAQYIGKRVTSIAKQLRD
jgi:NAD(P)H dehydrogenase (quinone)